MGLEGHKNLVLILDDRKDVWQVDVANIIGT